jgi:hypothetical protein
VFLGRAGPEHLAEFGPSRVAIDDRDLDDIMEEIALHDAIDHRQRRRLLFGVRVEGRLNGGRYARSAGRRNDLEIFGGELTADVNGIACPGRPFDLWDRQ